MPRPLLIAVLVITALIGAGMYTTKQLADSNGQSCLDFYADIIPADAELTNTVLNGSELHAYYRYAGGEDVVICEITDQYEMTYSDAMNRKLDTMLQNKVRSLQQP